MSLQPLLSAPYAIQLHTFAALLALVIGPMIFWAAKRTMFHRTLGIVWVALMAVVVASSFFIHEIKQFGNYSLIHVLSLATAVLLPRAVYMARRRNAFHRSAMIQIYLLALVGAGAFTLLPGRIMYQVVTGG